MAALKNVLRRLFAMEVISVNQTLERFKDLNVKTAKPSFQKRPFRIVIDKKREELTSFYLNYFALEFR